jgi:hypothetical protein
MKPPSVPGGPNPIMRDGPHAVTRALHAMRTAARCPTVVTLHAVARALHARCARPINFVLHR